MKRTDYEARFWTALKRIAAYDTPAQLRRQSGANYGLDFEEAIEMAYENIQQEAKDALRGYRRPKPDPPVAAPPSTKEQEG